MNNKKAFSNKDYNENDSFAKEISLDFLLKTNKFELKESISEQKEAYKNWDFLIFNKIKNKFESVESERKRVWTKSGEWQGYNTLDIPKRKEFNKSDYFIMCNYSGDTIALIKTKDVLNSKITKKDTFYTKNEEFFNVELEKIRFYTKINNKWIKIKNK